VNFNARQIFAALGLLGLNQNDLAEGVKMPAPSISRILGSENQPKDETTRRIYRWLEDKGVEFTELDGVRRRKEDVKIYEGIDGWKLFSDDRYQTALNSTRDFLSCGGVQDFFTEAAGEDYQKFHAARMKSIEHFKIRALRPMSYKHPNITNYVEYRAVPDEQFPKGSFYVYGGKLALLRFEPSLRIYVIQDREVSESYRALFEGIWANARPLREDGHE